MLAYSWGVPCGPDVTENQKCESKTGRVGMPTIQITGRLRQKGPKFKDSQIYRTLEKVQRPSPQIRWSPCTVNLCPRHDGTMSFLSPR